jgi:hypothetical protein
MKENTGWIKINRAINEHWVWSDDTKFKWWIDILLTVNFKDNKILIGNQLIECKRGQSIMSLQQWATRWKVDKNKVRNFFVLLEKDGMILHENLLKTTRITICNYDTYQSKENDTETQSKRKPNDKQTQTNPIEEGEESIKKEKEIKEELFESLWKEYPTKAGKQIAKDKFLKMDNKDIEMVKKHLPIFSKTKEFEKYNHPHLATYLNQKRYCDEVANPTTKIKYVRVRMGLAAIEMKEEDFEKALREGTLNCDNPIIEKRYEK